LHSIMMLCVLVVGSMMLCVLAVGSMMIYFVGSHGCWLEARRRMIQWHTSQVSLLLQLDTINFASTLKAFTRVATDTVPGLGPCGVRWLNKMLLAGGTPAVYGARFRQKFTLEDVIPLGSSFLTSSHCELRPNTEGTHISSPIQPPAMPTLFQPSAPYWKKQSLYGARFSTEIFTRGCYRFSHRLA
jgi:hypothetical protein